GACRRLVTQGRPLLGGIGDVDEMMRYHGPFCDGRLGRPDIESAVHLHRVERHDLDVTERMRGTEGERRLPRCSGPDKSEVRDRSYTAATGIRVRARRAGATIRTTSPRSQCGAASMMRTSTSVPASPAPPDAAKWTSLF